MPTVHLFVCEDRFDSFKAMRSFIDPTYTEDGDTVPSAFSEEIGLNSYEPMCIEAIHSSSPKPVRNLLSGTSYGDQWVSGVPADLEACQAVCVFEPNRVSDPDGSSLQYVGAYEYTP